MGEEVKGKALPVMNYYRVIRRRRRVILLLRRFAGRKLQGDRHESEMASALYTGLDNPESTEEQAHMPDQGHGIQNQFYHAILLTLQDYFTGQILTEAATMQLACLIAGNLPTLKMGSPVCLWSGQRMDEWALLLVMGVRRSVTPKRKILGGLMTLQVLTGSASGQTFTQFFSDPALQRMARHIGIMTRRTRRRMHPSEFGQMKFAGKLPEGVELSVKEYRERPSLNKRNRELMKRRGHGRVCPHQYITPCYACHQGFVDCVLGTHRYTFEQKGCLRCGELGFFDPEDLGQKICQRCLTTIWGTAG